MPGGWVLDDFSLLSLQFPQDLALNRRPLTYLTYWLNFALFGESPGAFRLTNILIHAAAVQLCFGALRRLIEEKRAFWAAMIFAIHPMQSEAVLYIFARPVLIMGAMLWWALDRWLAGKHWQSVTIGALALFAKEEAIAFPLVLAALHLSRSRGRADWAQQWTPLGVSFLCAALAGVMSVFTTASIQGSGAGAQSGVNPITYFATQPISLARYLWHALFPYPILFDAAPAPASLVWPLAWLVPLALLYWQRHRFANAGPTFWGLAALIFLVPTTSIFPLADLSAYRRMYLPIACLGVAGVAFLPKRNQAIFSGACAAVSLYYCQIWREPVRVWQMTYEHTITLRPALELARLSPPELAAGIVESRRNVGESNPDFHTELGRIQMSLRQPALSLKHFGKALALDPQRASHYYNRGAALLALGQKEAARADLERTLQIDPKHRLALRAIAAM